MGAVVGAGAAGAKSSSSSLSMAYLALRCARAAACRSHATTAQVLCSSQTAVFACGSGQVEGALVTIVGYLASKDAK